MNSLSCEISMNTLYERKEYHAKCFKCDKTLFSLCVANIDACCHYSEWKVASQRVATKEEEIAANFCVPSRSLHNQKIEKCVSECEKMLLTKEKLLEKDITSKKRQKKSVESDLKKLKQNASAEHCNTSIQDKADSLKETKERSSGLNELNDKKNQNWVLMKNFKNTQMFLSHISNLLNTGERVYACHKVNNHLRHGRVLYSNEFVFGSDAADRKDLLIMCSLSESQVEKDAVFIWYPDLQKCLTRKNLSIYLYFHEEDDEEEEYEKIFIFHPNQSRFLPQLIQLCTGEKGPTYKGAKFSVVKKQGMNYELNILNYVVDDVPTKGCIDPFLKFGRNKSLDENDITHEVFFYIKMAGNGRLTILNGTKNKAEDVKKRDNIIFYARYDSLFWREFEDYILDCGIAFEL